MNILIISSYLPYPLHSGGQVRLFNLIRELSKGNAITLICEKRSHQTIDDMQEIEKICQKVIAVPRRKQWSIQNIFKSVFSNNSFLITGHKNDEMQEEVEKILAAQPFDIIHVETFYVLQNLPDNLVPIVLVEHNIEYQVYQRYVDRAPLPMRPLLAIDIAKIRKEEESAWRRAKTLVAVSEEDKKVMQKKGFSPTVVANGVNTDQFILKNITASIDKKEKRILFLGDFSWIQNIDSVTFILKEIWPKISLELKAQNLKQEIKLWIVGRNIPESIRNLSTDPSILFDEKSSAKSTPEIFSEAAVLLAPIRVGGGTSYKIIESMACGTPVITMPLSAQAIEAKDDEQLLVGKNAHELAEKTINILQDKRLYERIAKHGRKLIEEKYSWQMIGKKLEEVYTQTA